MKKFLSTVFAFVVLLAFYSLCAKSCHSTNSTEPEPTPIRETPKPVVKTNDVEEVEDYGDVVEFTNQEFDEEEIDEDMNDVYSNTEI